MSEQTIRYLEKNEKSIEKVCMSIYMVKEIFKRPMNG